MLEDVAREVMRLGFSEREAAVYVALLRMGEAGGNELSSELGIPRASIYDTLESLGRMGLVTAFLEKEQKRFSAEPPERLLTMLHLQRRECAMREEYAERVLPRLAAVHRAHDTKPRIRYIEGLNGLRNMQREYELYEGDIIQLVGYDAYAALEDRKMSDEHRSLLQHRPRHVRTMLVTDRAIPASGGPSVEIRRVSPSVVEALGEVTVWGDRVIMFSYAGGIIAVEIASPAIAGTVKASLELAWKATEGMAGNR